MEEDKQLRPKDVLRDPYILDFLNLPDQHLHESDLEQGLLDNLQSFLLELGKGFAFVARQQRIRTEDQDFYIEIAMSACTISTSERVTTTPPLV